MNSTIKSLALLFSILVSTTVQPVLPPAVGFQTPPRESFFSSSPRTMHTPEHDIREFICEKLAGAKNVIFVAMYMLTDNHFTRAIVDAVRHNQNLKVVVIYDKASTPKGRLTLNNAILDLKELVHRYPDRVYLIKSAKKEKMIHHKMVIVDDEVISGSFNWTRAAACENYENIDIHNRKDNPTYCLSKLECFRDLALRVTDAHIGHDLAYIPVRRAIEDLVNLYIAEIRDFADIKYCNQAEMGQSHLDWQSRKRSLAIAFGVADPVQNLVISEEDLELIRACDEAERDHAKQRRAISYDEAGESSQFLRACDAFVADAEYLKDCEAVEYHDLMSKYAEQIEQDIAADRRAGRPLRSRIYLD